MPTTLTNRKEILPPFLCTTRVLGFIGHRIQNAQQKAHDTIALAQPLVPKFPKKRRELCPSSPHSSKAPLCKKHKLRNPLLPHIVTLSNISDIPPVMKANQAIKKRKKNGTQAAHDPIIRPVSPSLVRGMISCSHMPRQITKAWIWRASPQKKPHQQLSRQGRQSKTFKSSFRNQRDRSKESHPQPQAYAYVVAELQFGRHTYGIENR